MERARLNLGILEPLLEAESPLQASRRGVVQRQLPPSWHANVETARWVHGEEEAGSVWQCQCQCV